MFYLRYKLIYLVFPSLLNIVLHLNATLPVLAPKRRSLVGDLGPGGSLRKVPSAAVFQAPPPENGYNPNINSINSIRS